MTPANHEGAGLFIDIGQTSLQAAQGADAFEFPLERGEDGRLTSLCRERLTLGLRGFLAKPGRRAGGSAWCAVGARGVSLRRLNLPSAAKDEFQRVLRLQIESEFPLPPEELAWGWRAAGPAVAASNGAPARQEILVLAVKKDTLEDYAAILTDCGVEPVFTPAALVRAALYPALAGAGTILDIGRAHTEWVTYDLTGPTAIRVLAWGGENITRALQEKLGVSHDEADKLKAASSAAGVEKTSGAVAAALESALAALAERLRPVAPGTKIYLTGNGARDPRLAPLLAGLLRQGVTCESLETAAGPAHSAALAGLKKATAKNSATPPLVLEFKEGRHGVPTPKAPAWQWAAAAGALALAALFFPYGESLLLKPRLEKKLALVNADRGRLDVIDQELEFLQDLKQAQPPYLDTLYLLAKAAPPGTRLEALSLGRKGEISLRAKMNSAQQVTDFRSKLMDSGWFAGVVVEEQTPVQNQGVSVRITAGLNPANARKPLNVPASTNQTGRAIPAAAETMTAPRPAPPATAEAKPDSPGPVSIPPTSTAKSAVKP